MFRNISYLFTVFNCFSIACLINYCQGKTNTICGIWWRHNSGAAIFVIRDLSSLWDSFRIKMMILVQRVIWLIGDLVNKHPKWSTTHLKVTRFLIIGLLPNVSFTEPPRVLVPLLCIPESWLLRIPDFGSASVSPARLFVSLLFLLSCTKIGFGFFPDIWMEFPCT